MHATFLIRRRHGSQTAHRSCYQIRFPLQASASNCCFGPPKVQRFRLALFLHRSCPVSSKVKYLTGVVERVDGSCACNSSDPFRNSRIRRIVLKEQDFVGFEDERGHRWGICFGEVTNLRQCNQMKTECCILD